MPRSALVIVLALALSPFAAACGGAAPVHEPVLPVRGNRLAIVNDTNFGSTGRNPGLPDYSDFIVVRVPRLRGH